MKILLGDFNAKMGRQNILKPTIWNEGLHQDSNDNGVRIGKFVTSKNLGFKTLVASTKETTLIGLISDAVRP
jgi:hypothetical protein